jgi:hypothetical protein
MVNISSDTSRVFAEVHNSGLLVRPAFLFSLKMKRTSEVLDPSPIVLIFMLFIG